MQAEGVQAQAARVSLDSYRLGVCMGKSGRVQMDESSDEPVHFVTLNVNFGRAYVGWVRGMVRYAAVPRREKWCEMKRNRIEKSVAPGWQGASHTWLNIRNIERTNINRIDED